MYHVMNKKCSQCGGSHYEEVTQTDPLSANTKHITRCLSCGHEYVLETIVTTSESSGVKFIYNSPSTFRF